MWHAFSHEAFSDQGKMRFSGWFFVVGVIALNSLQHSITVDFLRKEELLEFPLISGINSRLLSSLHQPHTNLSSSDSSSSLSGTSSIGSIDSPLSSSVTPYSFIPGLKPSFWLFVQIFFTVAFIFFFRTDSTDFPDCLPIPQSIFVFICSFFPLFSCWFHVAD